MSKAELVSSALGADALDKIFRNARTHSAWQDRPVTDETLRELYDLLKWGPTSANGSPGRFLFIRSREAKERLRPVLSPGNVEKTMAAPVTAVVAYDSLFYDKLPQLFPHSASMRGLFVANPQLADETAKRNSALQGGYLIIAARALGLDCGPMSGFDNAKLDAEFFPEGQWKSNFLVNLGYGDGEKLFPRGPRLEFEEAATIL